MKHFHIYLIFLLAGSLFFSCDSKTITKSEINDKHFNPKQPDSIKVDIEYVKKSLCYQFLFNKGDTINCPDSIYTTQVQDSTLYLTQSFYGSGNPILINLIRIHPHSFNISDSLINYWASDMYKPEHLSYDTIMDWFVYTDEGSGTNHFSLTKNIVRIENDRFIKIFSYPEYISDMNPDENPMTSTSLKTKVIEISKKKIIILSTFEKGYLNNKKIKVTRTSQDVTTFVYSDSCYCYKWLNSSKSRFKDYWNGKIDYIEL